MLFKKETQTSPNHIWCVARLITNFGRKNQKKRERVTKVLRSFNIKVAYPILSAPSRAYLKSQQTRSRKRLPEEL